MHWSIFVPLILVNAVAIERNEDSTPLTASKTVFGGQHGDQFSDEGTAADKRIRRVTLAGCGAGEHVSAISIAYRAVSDHSESPEVVAYSMHGHYAGKAEAATLELKATEYIKEIAVTTWRKKVGVKRKTRIGRISIISSSGATIACGASNAGDPYFSWPESAEAQGLLYLSGTSGDALDSLEAHFLPTSEYFPSH